MEMGGEGNGDGRGKGKSDEKGGTVPFRPRVC